MKTKTAVIGGLAVLVAAFAAYAVKVLNDPIVDEKRRAREVIAECFRIASDRLTCAAMEEEYRQKYHADP